MSHWVLYDTGTKNCQVLGSMFVICNIFLIHCTTGSLLEYANAACIGFILPKDINYLNISFQYLITRYLISKHMIILKYVAMLAWLMLRLQFCCLSIKWCSVLSTLPLTVETMLHSEDFTWCWCLPDKMQFALASPGVSRELMWSDLP